MYCEGRVAVTSFPNIEHFRPKKVFPQGTFEWENLGLACGVCNVHKGDSVEPIVDPYSQPVAAHLSAEGPFVLGKTRLGRSTVDTTKLGRAALFKQRAERLADVLELIEAKIQLHGVDSMQVATAVERATKEDREFLFCITPSVQALLDSYRR